MLRLHLVLLVTCLTGMSCIYSQSLSSPEEEDSFSLKHLPSYLQEVDLRAKKVAGKTSAAIQKTVSELKAAELNAISVIEKKNTALAAEMREDFQRAYEKINNKLRVAEGLPDEYIADLDSMLTISKFLKGALGKSSSPVLSGKLSNAVENVTKMGASFRRAEVLDDFIGRRMNALKSIMANNNLHKQWKKISRIGKEYKQGIASYKAILKDRRKVERKVLELLQKNNKVQDFFNSHGFLAGLFQSPAQNLSSALVGAGLQSRGAVQAAIAQNGPANSISINQIIQPAQAELSKLKDKFAELTDQGQLGNLKVTPSTTPVVASFKKKIDFNLDVQSGKNNWLFPVTSDIGILAGYKASPSVITGLGLVYKVGWGSSFKTFRISHEGIGIRSFIDVKTKKQLFITGGIEYNFYHRIKDIEVLKNASAWKRAAVLGVVKKYKAGKRRGELRLLYDFLHAQTVPATQALIFRIGFGL